MQGEYTENSLRSSQTPEIRANTLRMLRASTDSFFVIVEGTSDRDYFRHVLGPKNLIVADGKSNVLNICRILSSSKDKFEGFVGVVDNDFDLILSQNSYPPKVITTYAHDLIVDCFLTTAFRKLLIHNASSDKLNSNGYDINSEEGLNTIRIQLMNKLKPLSILKLLNQQNEWKLSINKVKIESHIDKNNAEVKIYKLIDKAIRKGGHQTNSSSVKSCLEEHKNCEYDLIQLTNGHDLTKLLSVALQQYIGSLNSRDLTPEYIEQILMIGVSAEEIQQSTVYKQIVELSKIEGYSLHNVDF